jgi:hypothetical protein
MSYLAVCVAIVSGTELNTALQRCCLGCGHIELVYEMLGRRGKFAYDELV